MDTLFEVPEHWWHRKRCPVCGCALSIDFTHTYVVQRQWWFKIGATSRPRKRMNELARVDWQNYCLWPEGMDWTEPLTVHLMVEQNIEHQLHQQFQGQHAVGEWFEIGGPIEEWLAQQAVATTIELPDRSAAI